MVLEQYGGHHVTRQRRALDSHLQCLIGGTSFIQVWPASFD